MKRWLLLAGLLVPLWAGASFPRQATLAQLATGADHILIGTVIGVDMVDEDGIAIVEPAAGTGPGLKNVIRLQVRVDETLVTNASKVPPVLAVPLDPFMHYTLGVIQAAHAGENEPQLLLLKGAAFEPIVAGVFFRPLSDQSEALRLHAASRR